MGATMTLNYASYLKLDQLLHLQEPKSDPVEHDEMLFIIIHQVYELWFKQLLHELDQLKGEFSSGELFGALATLKRFRMIMKTLVGQLDILETMTPMSFTAFRDRLDTASGFQSTQFREFEFALGYKRPEVMDFLDRSWPGYAAAEQRLREPSVIDHFYDFLESRGVGIPERLRRIEPPGPAQPDVELQRSLLAQYKSQPDLAVLFEQMMDVDEGLQEWRYRHVKIVERTIGRKHGTGGSLGVEFLKKSLFKPVFPDLWAIRQEL
jgi:tryptophan 2,3-dioxygenase